MTGPFGFGDSHLYFEVDQLSDRLQLVVREIPSGEELHTTTAATNRMETAVGRLADRADRLLSDLLLGNPELAGEDIPGTDVSLNDLFHISDYFRLGPALDAYLAPLQQLGADSDFEIDEFLNYLRGNWLDDLLGGDAHAVDWQTQTFTGTGDWIHGITVGFSGSATYTDRIPVGLSETVDGIGPAFTDLEVSVDATFAFTLSLGWSDTDGATYDFNVSELNFDLDTGPTNLVVPLKIGDLEASAGHPAHTAASIDLNLHVDLAYDEDAGEYIVTYDPLGDEVSHVAVSLPIYASLAGVDVNPGPTGTIGIGGDLFLTAEGGRGSTDVAVTSAHLESFTPFTRLTLAGLKGELEGLRDNFLENVRNSGSFDIDVPFVDLTLADVLDLGAAFDLAVMSRLDFDALDSLQDFVAAVTSSGLLPAGEDVTYNTTTRTLKVPHRFRDRPGRLEPAGPRQAGPHRPAASRTGRAHPNRAVRRSG